MQNSFPQAVHAELSTHILKVTFDNGAVRYLLDHTARTQHDFWTKKEGVTVKNALATRVSWASWLGNAITVADDGTVTLNGTDVYTPEELWSASSDQVTGLYARK
jgi:hypothetical protein